MTTREKSTLPMLLINWIFGMGIIEYPPGNEYRVVSFLYSSICLLGYCSTAIYAYPRLLSMTKEFEATPIILNITFYSNLIVTIGTIISGWKRSKGVRLILFQMRNTDRLLESLGARFQYSRDFKAQLGMLICRMSFIFMLISMHSFILLEQDTIDAMDIAVIVSLGYPIILMYIVDTTYVNFVVAAFRHYHKLNDTLRKMLTTSKDYPQHKRIVAAFLKNKISETEQINLIQVDATYKLTLANKAHLELVHLCRATEETFNTHLLYTIVVAIAVITGCLYQISVHFPCLRVDNSVFYRVLLHNGVWVFYYSLKIIIYSSGCSLVEQEAKTTGDIISEFYDEPSSTDETKAAIREFHCHLIRNVISFSACGFIKIDFSLIKVILSSITTYLMIISQFGNFIVPKYNNSRCY